MSVQAVAAARWAAVRVSAFFKSVILSLPKDL
jgi:hypothetical protein